MTAYIHSFESLAAVDGDGVRFAVFFSGCPLRCVYCHNPDTWKRGGEEYTAERLVKKISRYKPYFKTHGGVTFTGGEPMLWAAFIAECVPLLREAGIPYVIDTSGAVSLSENEKYVLRNAQRVLLDLKFPTDEEYIKYTGVGIENSLKTLSFLDESSVPTTVKTVVVPGINDSEEKIGEYLSHLKGVRCVDAYELLPFHTMGFFKYELLGIENPLASTPALPKEKCLAFQRIIDEYINIKGEGYESADRKKN